MSRSSSALSLGLPGDNDDIARRAEEDQRDRDAFDAVTRTSLNGRNTGLVLGIGLAVYLRREKTRLFEAMKIAERPIAVVLPNGKAGEYCTCGLGWVCVLGLIWEFDHGFRTLAGSCALFESLQAEDCGYVRCLWYWSGGSWRTSRVVGGDVWRVETRSRGEAEGCKGIGEVLGKGGEEVRRQMSRMRGGQKGSCLDVGTARG